MNEYLLISSPLSPIFFFSDVVNGKWQVDGAREKRVLCHMAWDWGFFNCAVECGGWPIYFSHFFTLCHRQPTTILLVSLCVSGERFGLLLKVQQKMNIFNFIILYVENRNIRVKRTPSIWIVWKTYEISSSSPTPRSHLIQFYTTENPFDQLWWRLVVTAHVDSHSQLVVTQRPCISTNDPP